MENEIDPGARRVKRRLAADRMGDHLPAEAMALAHHVVGFVLGEGGDQFAVGAALDAVERDLYESTPFLTWRRTSSTASLMLVTSLPIEVSGAPIQVGYQSVEALMRREVRPRRHDPRSVEEAGTDRVADRER